MSEQPDYDCDLYIFCDADETSNERYCSAINALRKRVQELEAERDEMKKYMSHFEPFKTWIEEDKTDSISGSPNCNFTYADLEALEASDDTP